MLGKKYYQGRPLELISFVILGDTVKGTVFNIININSKLILLGFLLLTFQHGMNIISKIFYILDLSDLNLLG